MALSTRTRTQLLNNKLRSLIYMAHGLDLDSKFEGNSESARAYRKVLKRINRFPDEAVIIPSDLDVKVRQQIILLNNIATVESTKDYLSVMMKAKKDDVLSEVENTTESIEMLSPESILKEYDKLEASLVRLDLDIVRVENRNPKGAEKEFSSRINKLKEKAAQEEIRKQLSELESYAAHLLVCLFTLTGAGDGASIAKDKLDELEQSYKAIQADLATQKQEQKGSIEQTIDGRIKFFVDSQFEDMTAFRNRIEEAISKKKTRLKKTNASSLACIAKIQLVKKSNTPDVSFNTNAKTADSEDSLFSVRDFKLKRTLRHANKFYASTRDPQLITNLNNIPDRLNLFQARVNDFEQAAPDLSFPTRLLVGAGILGTPAVGAAVLGLCFLIFGLVTGGIAAFIPGIIGTMIAWRMSVHGMRGLEREGDLISRSKAPGLQDRVNKQRTKQRIEAQPTHGFINKLLGESASSRDERSKLTDRGILIYPYNKPFFQALNKVPAPNATEVPALILGKGLTRNDYSQLPVAYRLKDKKVVLKPLLHHPEKELPSDDDECEKELDARLLSLRRR